MNLSLLALLGITVMSAQTLRGTYSLNDSTVSLDPNSAFWKDAPVASFQHDSTGRDTGLKPTDVRVRWSKQFLYVLFVGRYEAMYLKPEPVVDKDTVPLWDWDVAELFIGADFDNIQRYKEFEVSPQGEWVDLNVRKDLNEFDWHWNSGFEPAARIDREAKVWYGAMKIPWKAIDSKAVKAGSEFRVNFYRIEGAPPSRTFLAWQPTKSASYHVPEAFGRLILSE
jgi:Carbohydrate family 9 binding domain-like